MITRRRNRFIIEQCYELAYHGSGVSFDEWAANCSDPFFDQLTPVRIVAVRLVSCELSSMTSCLNDGSYSSDERRRIAAMVDKVTQQILDGVRKLPSSLPIPATGVHRHRSEPRRTKADDEARFAGTGVHRVREFSYDKRTLKFGQLLTDVD